MIEIIILSIAITIGILVFFGIVIFIIYWMVQLIEFLGKLIYKYLTGDKE